MHGSRVHVSNRRQGGVTARVHSGTCTSKLTHSNHTPQRKIAARKAAPSAAGDDDSMVDEKRKTEKVKTLLDPVFPASGNRSQPHSHMRTLELLFPSCMSHVTHTTHPHAFLCAPPFLPYTPVTFVPFCLSSCTHTHTLTFGVALSVYMLLIPTSF